MDKKQMLAEAIEGKSKTDILAEAYWEAKNELMEHLDTLNMAGKPCLCEGDLVYIKTVHEGYYDEIATTCLECGGYIEL